MKAIYQVSIIAILAVFCFSAVDKDLVPNVPGYDESFKTPVYAGYLSTISPERRLHYVFVAAEKDANTAPLTLWLNGGPGCSSLLGFLQEIGPFYLEDGKNYTKGQKLVRNPYSWNNLSNLLFLQSPAGVGYSVNTNSSYQYNDLNTLNDNFAALQDFFKKYPQYTQNPFWIAGESYAGKYIPDLAVLIDSYNQNNKTNPINLKGIFVGNGVMNFKNQELDKSEAEYMMGHEFIDPELIIYYTRSCLTDESSAGCQYFKARYESNIEEINPYSNSLIIILDVYDYCFYDNLTLAAKDGQQNFHSQESILKQFARTGKFKSTGQVYLGSKGKTYTQGAPCAYFTGLYQYFNAHVSQYHGDSGMTWNGPCASKISEKYTIDQSGSMNQYKHLLGVYPRYHLILYNGDWDGVVPYTDTIKNFEKLDLKDDYHYSPFFVNDQHAGFATIYSGISWVILKGASHQVPQSKRAQAYDVFRTAMMQSTQKQFMESLLSH